MSAPTIWDAMCARGLEHFTDVAVLHFRGNANVKGPPGPMLVTVRTDIVPESYPSTWVCVMTEGPEVVMTAEQVWEAMCHRGMHNFTVQETREFAPRADAPVTELGPGLASNRTDAPGPEFGPGLASIRTDVVLDTEPVVQYLCDLTDGTEIPMTGDQIWEAMCLRGLEHFSAHEVNYFGPPDTGAREPVPALAPLAVLLATIDDLCPDTYPCQYVCTLTDGTKVCLGANAIWEAMNARGLEQFTGEEVDRFRPDGVTATPTPATYVPVASAATVIPTEIAAPDIAGLLPAPVGPAIPAVAAPAPTLVSIGRECVEDICIKSRLCLFSDGSQRWLQPREIWAAMNASGLEHFTEEETRRYHPDNQPGRMHNGWSRAVVAAPCVRDPELQSVADACDEAFPHYFRCVRVDGSRTNMSP